jgi:hypothetical protein
MATQRRGKVTKRQAAPPRTRQSGDKSRRSGRHDASTASACKTASKRRVQPSIGQRIRAQCRLIERTAAELRALQAVIDYVERQAQRKRR